MARVEINLPEVFPFVTEIDVRVCDINAALHVGNEAILEIIAEGRTRFMKRHGYGEMDVEGAGLIMADAAVVYKSEAFYDDVLILEVGVRDFTECGFDFIYRITNKETKKEVACAKNGFVFFDYEGRTPVKVPRKFKTLFA